MYYVYILRNAIKNQIYVGSTKDLRKRLREHNEGKEISTKRYLPWSLIYYEAFVEENLARIREQKLKYSGNSMKELKKRIGLSRNGAGFTLIEILIVMAIISLASIGSYVGFVQFNRQQNLTSTWDTLRNNVNEAKSNATSQVIVTGVCNQTSRTLVGHQIAFGRSGATDYYELQEVCTLGVNTLTPVVKRVNLPSKITFNPLPSLPVRFLILSGGVINPATITITNQSRARSIRVDSTGVIR